MGKISILIASSGNTDKDSIFSILSQQNDFYITSVEKDIAGAIINSQKLKPDVIILDFYPLKGFDELELVASIIRRKTPSSSIILICDKNDNDYAAKALGAGITGLLLRKKDMDKLACAVKIVKLGGIFISASINIGAFGHSYKQFPENPVFFSFTSAERGILKDIAKGFSDNEIAERLNYSAGTIRNILVKLKRKTKMKNRVQIILYLHACGIINLELNDLLNNDKNRYLPLKDNSNQPNI